MTQHRSAEQTDCKKRRGLSLLEVILALAILALSMAAIGELIRIGTHSARHAQDMTKAQILCESKLSEIVAGAAPYDPITRAAMPLDPDWYYTVQLQPTEEEGLMALGVTVETHIDRTHPLAFTLVRWVPDPGIELPDEQPQPEQPDNADNNTDDSDESNQQDTGTPGFGT